MTMRIFGRTLGEYIRFEAGLLALIVVVGLLRFGLYQAGIHPSGAPNAGPAAPPEKVVAIARWFSMTAVLVLGAVVLGFVTHRRGFGGYKHLLPLNLLAAGVAHWVSGAGVLTAIVFQTDTIYTLPRFTAHGDGKTLQHALGHLFIAPLITGVAGWVLSAVVMLATRRRPKKAELLPIETADPAPAPEPTVAPPAAEPPAPPSESAATVE